MTDLTDEQINEQIEAAYETLRNVVEQLGKNGASPLTLGVALIGVAVEIAVSVGGRDGETLIREIVDRRDRVCTLEESGWRRGAVWFGRRGGGGADAQGSSRRAGLAGT